MTTKCRACTREMTEWAKRNCEEFCTQCFHTTSALPEEKEMNKLFSVHHFHSNEEIEGFFQIDQSGNLTYLNGDGDWVEYPKGFRIVWNQEQ